MSDISAELNEAQSDLSRLSFSGNTKKARRLLSNGLDANFVDPGSRATPLQQAIYFKRQEFVDLLLEYGADVNMVGSRPTRDTVTEMSTWTPLMLAYQNLAIMSSLLARGANPDIQDEVLKCTVLHMTARNDEVETTMMLLKAGANRCLRDNNGRTPLQSARFNRATSVVDAWTSYEAAERAQGIIAAPVLDLRAL